LTPTGGKDRGLIRFLDHQQGVAWVTRLASARISHVLRPAHGLFDAVAGWRFAPLLAFLPCLAFSLLDALEERSHDILQDLMGRLVPWLTCFDPFGFFPFLLAAGPFLWERPWIFGQGG
jgi:hypothetical protein